MASPRRIYKLSERIQALIARELLRVADPRFSLVTITSVVVSSDMRNAKVYWMVSDDIRIPEVEDAFQGAEGMFRRVLAADLGIKFVPSLKFFYDDTIDVSQEVSALFDRVEEMRAPDEKKSHGS